MQNSAKEARGFFVSLALRGLPGSLSTERGELGSRGDGARLESWQKLGRLTRVRPIQGPRAQPSYFCGPPCWPMGPCGGGTLAWHWRRLGGPPRHTANQPTSVVASCHRGREGGGRGKTVEPGAGRREGQALGKKQMHHGQHYTRHAMRVHTGIYRKERERERERGRGKEGQRAWEEGTTG